jgi:MYXO-CTERM domain-containing protein
LLVLAFLTVAAPSPAAGDCPPGSVFRSQDGYTFCEATVCLNDGQCTTDEVCRPVPLCLQVGTLTPDAATLGDAGKRLVATQQCAPDQSCPQSTVCSALSRCVRKAVAERMGLLAAANPAGSAPTGTNDAPPAKKSCGCRVVGTPPPGRTWEGAFALGIAALAVLRRRRAR